MSPRDDDAEDPRALDAADAADLAWEMDVEDREWPGEEDWNDEPPTTER